MNEDMIEAIAERVHQAWMAEKQRQGFANHTLAMCPDKHGRDWKASCPWGDAKHHADMLPYADLAEHVKEYDRATVRGVLSALDEAGFVIVQSTGNE